jgi:predicted metal-dependent hydrolase
MVDTRPRRRKAMRGDEFKTFVAVWAERINVRPRRVQVQVMTKKWASCSTSGTVTFATDLLSESEAFREYVVVHELLHLIVANHGRVFRSLLRTYLPKTLIDASPELNMCGVSRN